VLVNAGEFARQQQEVATLRKRIEELEVNINKEIAEVRKASDDFVKTEDIEQVVSDAVDEHDFTDNISDALDDAISNRDWDYELREAVDWDRVAERVSEKLDWPTIISDNEIVCSGDYDFDDMMLKSDHMSEDDLVTRDDLSDMVVGETKRDWFTQVIADLVKNEFDKNEKKADVLATENLENCIEDTIEISVEAKIVEAFKTKFGDTWENWHTEFVRFTVKTVLGEMLTSAYEQTKNEGGQS